MIKVVGFPKAFRIRERWHKQIEEMFKVKNLPYEYQIEEKEEAGKGGACYLASNGKHRILISEAALNYLCGEEVPDCNAGMYFKDYLPTENSCIMLKGKEKVIPVKASIAVYKASERAEDGKTEGKSYPFIDWVLTDILTGNTLSFSSRKNDMWKHIAYGDIIQRISKSNDEPLDKHLTEISAHMSDMEKMIQDTIAHKIIVSHVICKFAEYLEGNGMAEDAKELRDRACVHDNSKLLNKEEFQALTGIINDKSCLRDAHSALSAFKQDAIELHWKNNRHHPEHFEDASRMGKVDRYEFVCDCCARSIQYGTDLLGFMETRQKERFHFPELMFEEIMKYCKIAVSL